MLIKGIYNYFKGFLNCHFIDIRDTMKHMEMYLNTYGLLEGDNKMDALHDLPNISKVIEEKLLQSGIASPQQLKDIGSKEAFSRIKTHDSSACINMLYALEGAIEGIRWHNLPDDKKLALKEFFKSF